MQRHRAQICVTTAETPIHLAVCLRPDNPAPNISSQPTYLLSSDWIVNHDVELENGKTGALHEERGRSNGSDNHEYNDTRDSWTAVAVAFGSALSLLSLSKDPNRFR